MQLLISAGWAVSSTVSACGLDSADTTPVEARNKRQTCLGRFE